MRALLTLALLVTPGVAQAQVTMTLAEARGMTGPALAAKVLGADAARDIVEVTVLGDGGGMIAQPGLNTIRFFRTPRDTEFPGLCRVEYVWADFSSGGRVGSDLPHRLLETATNTTFALLARPGQAPSGTCAALTPLDDRDSPRLFGLGDKVNIGEGTSATMAYFGAVAVVQAQTDTAAWRAHVRCTPDPGDETRTECRDPLLTITRFPLERIDSMQVYPCTQGAPRLCVEATHSLDPGKQEQREVRLVIETDAVAANPSAAFHVVSIAVLPATVAYD